jgi:hypothetical protein
MKCSKRSFVLVSVLFAMPLSLGIGTLNERGVPSRPLGLLAAVHKYLLCTISRLKQLPSLRMSERLPGLHPLLRRLRHLVSAEFA